MSNLGLKPYTKQLTSQVGNITGYVNLNKRDNNVILDIPIISSSKASPINLSMTYNNQNGNSSSYFGKGMRLNYIQKIVVRTGIGVTLEKTDGINEVFTVDTEFENTYKNEETLATITKVEPLGNVAGYYSYKDKYGNMFKYSLNDTSYPYEYKTKNNEIYTITKNNNIYTIANSYNEKVVITELDSSIEFEYLYCGSNNVFKGYKKTIVLLDASDKVTQIKYYMLDNSTNTYLLYDNITFNFSSTAIALNNVSNNTHLVYTFVDGLVTSVKEYNVTGYEKNTMIDYSSYVKTVVTNYDGTKVLYYFDENYLPSYELSDKGIVKGCKYNKNTKLLEKTFGPMSIINDDSNLLYNEGLVDFDGNTVVISQVQMSSNDIDLSQFCNNDLYQATGTGEIEFTLNESVLESDVLTLSMFMKNINIYSSSRYVKVEVLIENTKCIEHTFDNQLLSTYQFVSFSGRVNKNASSFKIKFSFVGDASIQIANLLLAKKSFGTIYNYDESKNVISKDFGNTSEEQEFNFSNLLSSKSLVDSSSTGKLYNRFNLLQKSTEHYGVVVENGYDSRKQLNSKTITSPHNTAKINNKREYTYDTNDKVTEYNLSQTAIYENEYDIYGRVTSVIDKINNSSTNYLYNLDKLIKLQYTEGSNSIEYQYEYYTDNKLLKKITCPDGLVYSFTYDNYNNLLSVSMNNKVFEQYQYDYTKFVMSKIIYSNGDSKTFNYNMDLLLTEEIYKDSNGLEIKKYQYQYDDKYQLIKVLCDNVEVLSIEYDVNGQINKIIENNCEISYKYDHLNLMNNEFRLFGDILIHQSYDTIHRSKGSNPENLNKYFEHQNDLFVATFTSDLKAKRYSNSLTPTFVTNSETETAISFVKTYDGIIPCLELSSQKKLSYHVNIDQPLPLVTGSLGFWFKKTTNSITRECLFSSKGTNRNDHLEVYLEDDYLYLEAIDNSGVITPLCRSTYPINTDEWNFFALSFENRHDGEAQGSTNSCHYSLILNSSVSTYSKSNPRLYVELDLKAIYNIGNNYNGSSHSDFFTGKITTLFIGPNRYTNIDKILEYYKITKDYLVDNQYNDGEVKAVDFGVGRLSNFSKEDVDNYKIFAYHNSVESLSGDKPVYFTQRTLSNIDKDRTFNFNNKIKDYAFVLDGNQLKYNFNFDTMGTILTKVLFDVYNDKQYIFELKDINNNLLSLYRNDQRRLVVEFNGQATNTSFILNNNHEWNIIGLSFKQQIAADSTESTGLQVRVYLNGEIFETLLITTATINAASLSLGAKHNKEEIDTLLSSYETNYPLYGLIEYMIVKEDSYLSTSTMDDLSDQMNVTKKVNLYDEFGLLKKSEVLEGNSSVVSNIYSYKTVNNNQYLTTDPKQEVIKLNNTLLTTRQYETDCFSRITRVDDDVFGDNVYSYNKKGYLVGEGQTIYTYDNNGNMVSNGDLIFSYESGKLTSIGNNSVVYDPSNDLFIKQVGDIYFTYENNRLKRYSDNHKGDHITYRYNKMGLITEKNMFINETDFINVYYKYNGNKLVSEIRNDYRLDFLYDENNMLYGFIYNNSLKYYYIRDVSGLILGIALQNGTKVVDYKYNAWGKILLINDTSGLSIGTINPFRYKGYYYDSECKMYYCISRFYNPEWCRWLTPDNVDYLVPYKTNTLNLFLYCNNNPVMYVDYNGHMPKWLAWTLSVIAIAGGVVLCATGLGGILGGVLIGAGAGSLIGGYTNEAKGGSFTAGYIGGAISGALCGAGAGLGGAALVTAGEVANLACIGYVALGFGVSFAGGFVGSIAGTVSTNLIDSDFQSLNIDWKETFETATIMGGLNMVAGFASGLSSVLAEAGAAATTVGSQWTCRVLAGFIAGAAEAVYDITAYLIEKILSK